MGLYLAACDQADEESPKLTNGHQDANVTNAKKEEKSIRVTHRNRFTVLSERIYQNYK